MCVNNIILYNMNVVEDRVISEFDIRRTRNATNEMRGIEMVSCSLHACCSLYLGTIRVVVEFKCTKYIYVRGRNCKKKVSTTKELF